ncbi:AraC-like DNA-binding protein [Mucilaginibacter gracilis]|uniref:AraC-like DNA-binding protein n=1 Tax=Mucilaginibacter gracilis TaxID=423350 RepID=A0A495J9G2_9SPHI|nr:AraC family transcriptional regulator [Mucilaginibacter gracilis]RKR85118.1 AraC-like DNA-binding protein [Mucilaginibacter gracilis]
MIRITSALWDEYVYDLDAPSKRENLINYAGSWGSVRIVTIYTADISVFVFDLNCKDDCPVILEINTLCLMMIFTLSGTYRLNAGKNVLFTASKHHSLFSSGYLRSSAILQGDLKLFAICFTKNSLQKTIPTALVHFNPNEGIFTEWPALLRSIRPTTPQMSMIIQAIMVNIDKNKRGNQHIYFEAKALELLFLELEQIDAFAGRSTNSYLKEDDLERIHQAKIIVEQNLLNPCSLIELAHKVGLNDFKLKKGFREVLGTTVFGYLYDLRMEKAKFLLKSGNSVREVAYEVGYKNAHHFTTAFKKKFGHLPSKVNKL